MKEDIVERVRLLSKSYLSESKYNSSGKEVINVLTNVYKDMLIESQNNSQYLINKHQVEMFNLLDSEIDGIKPLSSLAQFSLMPNVEGQYLNMGMQLQTNSSTDTLLTLTLQEDIYVSNTNLNYIYCIEGKTGKTVLYDPNNCFYAFDFSKEGEEKNMFSFVIPYLFEENPPTHFQLYFSYMDMEATNTMITLVAPNMQWYLQSQDIIICPLKVIFHQNYLEISYEKEYLENLSLITTPTSILVNCKDTRRVQDCFFDQIYVKSSCDFKKADFIYVEQIPEAEEMFFPFTKNMELYTSSYLAFSNVLCRKNAIITISFTVDYQIVEVNPFSLEEKEYHLIMRSLPKELVEVTEVFCDIVVFEYFNGEQWTIIPELKQEKNIFQDAISKNISLRFICPSTMTKTVVEGIEEYWIRVRMLGCDNLYKYPLKMHVPMIKNLQANYQYKNTDLIVKQVEVTSRFLWQDYSKDLVEHKKIEPFTIWHQTNDEMYLCFEGAIVSDPFTLYIECREQCERKQTLRFYIGTITDFKEITVVDDTDGLSHSGIWRFYLEGDLVKTEHFNKQGYWIKIVNIAKTETKPIYIESIQKNIALVKEGNFQIIKDVVNTYDEDLEILLPDTQIEQISVFMYEKDLAGQGHWVEWFCLVDALRQYTYCKDQQKLLITKELLQQYIVSAYKIEFWQTQKSMQQVLKDSPVFLLEDHPNIMDSKTICHSYGSLPAETNVQAINRITASMQYYNGVTTSEDIYQYLLHEYRTMLDVKVLEQKDALGNTCKGQLTIACMMNDYNVDSKSFYSIKDKVKKYIVQYSNIGFTDSTIVIMEPIYIEVKLTLKVVVSRGNALDIKTKLVDCFTSYFDPVIARQGVGWKIGEYPRNNDIIEYVRQQNMYCYVKDCHIQGSFTYQGKAYIQSIEEFSTIPLGCIIPGKHHIEVIKGEDIYVG